MICYASSTRTRRNLHALHVHGWRLLVSAAAPDGWTPGWRYGLDNGAWSAHQQGAPFDEAAFVDAVNRFGGSADWVVVPDVVAGGVASLELSARWVDWVVARSRLALIPVQDGMSPADVAPLLGPGVGLAVGGSTEWKERTLGRQVWRGMAGHLHVLRVNTARRISLCAHSGAHSFDGSGPTRFSIQTPRLTQAARQGALWAS